MPSESDYEGREQTQVKHLILRHYLERFSHIVGSHWSSITYVDCFAGPWNARTDDLADSSFSIALEELRRARSTHAKRGHDVQLRCFFLEQNRAAFQRLKSFRDQVTDADVRVVNHSFEPSVQEIVRFIQAGGKDTFPFIFIDPTGWTGFGLRQISPLLKLNPSEVLVNFMTSHIRRFLTREESRSSFEELFGSADFRDRLEGLAGLELEDAAVDEYCLNLQRTGGFKYVRRAIVLHPEIDRTHFHLIYATRHPKGLEVFKESEKLAMREMEKLRGLAQERRRETRTGQLGLFGGQESPEGSHYVDLRSRYLSRARQAVFGILREQRTLPYDEAWATALSEPLVWESDLKDWIGEWSKSGALAISGLGERRKVPQWGAGHTLHWLGS